MKKQTPAEDRTKFADRHHQTLPAELAGTRVGIRARNLFEPIEELQLEDGGQVKRLAQSAAGMLEFETTASVMQAKMANTDKAIGKDMGKETANELEDMQGHLFLFAIVTVVEIFEGNGVLANGDNAVIGNGNAEDVATEIFEEFLFVVERFLNVDFPIFGQGFGEHRLHIELAIVGVEITSRPELGEFKAEAIAEHIGKQQDREEELVGSGIPRVARRVGDQRATCDDEMNVKMLLQSLPPSMHDQRKADVAAEILLTELLQ